MHLDEGRRGSRATDEAMDHRVLVIEDDADTLGAITQLLRGAGYDVIESPDGLDALGKLRQEPPPCVILLDLMMPGLDGWGFMNQVRVYPDLSRIPIVVVSAYGSAEGVRSIGAADYLRKPFDPEALLEVVARHCPVRS